MKIELHRSESDYAVETRKTWKFNPATRKFKSKRDYDRKKYNAELKKECR